MASSPSTADVALVAQAIDDELPLIGITASWSAAQAVIVALDKAQRLAPTPGVQRCGECDREILLGRLCQSCRRAEDGPYDERCDDLDLHQAHALSDLEDARMEATR